MGGCEMAGNEVELIDDIDEPEESEEELTPEKVAQAVVHGTDWTVETVLSPSQRPSPVFGFRFRLITQYP